MAIVDVRKFDASEHRKGTISHEGKCAAGNCGAPAKWTVEGSTKQTPLYRWAVCDAHRPKDQ